MISLRRQEKTEANERASTIWWAVIAVAFVAAAAYYYWADVFFLPAPERWRPFLGSLAHHEMGFVLFALPVVLAAVHFYVRGALIVALAATLTLVPHAVSYTSSPDPWFRVASFAAITLLLGGLVGSLLRSRRLLLAQQSDLEQFITRSLQVQEEEKQYLARELHDETAQQLVDVLHEIDEVQEAAAHDPATNERLLQLRDTVEGVLDGTRRFMLGLRPPQLDELGLVPSLQWLCDEMDGDTESVEVTLETDGNPPPSLSKDAELAVYRIAQEALTNVRRHSHARSAGVNLSRLDDGIRLSISDDGVGFNARPSGDLARHGKFGLIGLAERARLAGGAARIESAPGRGTRVTVDIPAAASR